METFLKIPEQVILPPGITRETRLESVARTFAPLLQGTVLDVGCDERYLKQFLSRDVKYIGVDLWGKPDVVVNLEHGLPFKERSFDTVVCFDVLEHLENIHIIFDELCRVTRNYVIIGLPNVASLKFRLEFLLQGRLPTGKYGLPAMRPKDRHRWLFSLDEAHQFVHTRGREQGMAVLSEVMVYVKPETILGMLYRLLGRLLGQKYAKLFSFSYWVVLQKA
ncbi:MAG: class I SAM-dependent methyltransferase [Anaerolineae bacterium]